MDLLEQAKRKFKVGTVFSNVNLDCGCSNIKVDALEFRDNEKSISLYSRNKGWWYTIYDKITKKWATIHNKQNYELWD